MNRKTKHPAPFQPDLMAFPMGWGGRRKGSGRKSSEQTTVIRIPVSILNQVTAIKQAYTAGDLISVTVNKRDGEEVFQ